jgi:teichuronic acid biosynthesis glycosyltransferase TuaH
MTTKPNSSDANSLFIVCGNTPFDENPLGARPLAQSLSKEAVVIYVDPPLSLLTVLKQPRLRKYIRAPRFEKVSDNLYRLIPFVVPGKDRPFINRITSYVAKHKIKKSIAEIKRHRSISHVTIIATAPHYRLFDKAFTNVYWMMDDYASQPELTGIDPEVLRKGQDYLSRTSDHIVAVSKQLGVTQDNFHEKCSIVPNGVDIDTFSRNAFNTEIAHELFDIPDTFALYVGGLNNRVNLEYLDALAEADVPLVIAGSIDSKWDVAHVEYFEKLKRKAGVHYLGSIEYENIPSLMYAAGVGLVPYASGKFNEASMPLKIPEYLSTGLTVVTTALGFSTLFEEEDVLVAHDVDEFVELTQAVLRNPMTPGQRAMRSARIARDWSWDTQARHFLALRKSTSF